MVAPPDHPTKGNVVVRYHGKGLAKPVLFLGHLDVVEAKSEDWSVEPFKLTEKDGWFYGRGSIDMKDGDAAMLETLVRLKRERFAPDRDAERLSQIVRLNAQLRTTCVATLISGGHAENALPQRAKATMQCRMMPGDSAEQVQAALIEVLADPKIAVTLDAPPIVSPESPPTAQITARVARVVHSMWPGVPLVPTMATGFSDDRQTRNAGIVSYDLSGVWADVSENRAHGRDERIGMREFDESVEYTYRLMKAMSQKE
jgi:acetylornithine deacetylase/succinyl-diaminopimelate desuccinylase-like protein